MPDVTIRIMSKDEATATLKQLDQGLRQMGADAQKAGTELKQGFGKSLVGSFTELKSAIDLAGMGFNTFTRGMQSILEFGREGAALEYTQQKFDRLAASIGLTSDALMIQLKDATRGMVADSKLMGSAGDLMSLGLAKTSDQVVRLTTVAGGLNMNMNQLVLTLANKTTMRFDQLGVAVDGFDERLKKLQESGMSVNDAFTEAFLQQAEDQLKKIGSAADSAQGAYIRLDTTIQNLKDHLAIKSAPFLERVAAGLDTLLTLNEKIAASYTVGSKAAYTQSKTYEEYTGRLKEAAGVLNLAINENGDLVDALGRVRVENYQLTQSEYEKAKATEEAAQVTQQANATNREYNVTADEMALKQYEAAHSVKALTQEMEEQKKRAEELKELQKQLASAQDAWQNAAKDWSKTVGGDVVSALQNAHLNATKYREALGLVDQTLGTTFGRQQDYTNAIKDLVTQFASGKIDSKQFQQGLSDLRTSFADLSEPLQAAISQLNDIETRLRALDGQHVSAYVDIYTNSTGAGGTGGPANNPGAGQNYRPPTPIPQAEGGDWWVTSPTLFLAGDQGPERATFTPAYRPSPAGGVTRITNVNYYIYDEGAQALAMADRDRLQGQRLDESMGE